MSAREPRVLTCIEHWIPLFAAKQMGANRQLLFSPQLNHLNTLDEEINVFSSG